MRTLFFAALLALPVAATAQTDGGPQARPAELVVEIPKPTAFRRGLRSTRELPTIGLQNARKRMIAGRSVSYATMQRIADLGDGFAALRVAEYLEAENNPELLPDIAHYYARAAYTGRGGAVYPLIRLAREHGASFSETRRGHIQDALGIHAEHGNIAAAKALVEFYNEGTLFGSQEEASGELIEKLISLNLLDSVKVVMFRRAGEEATKGALSLLSRTFLEKASQSSDLTVRSTAENMLRQADAIVEEVTSEVLKVIAAPVPALPAPGRIAPPEDPARGPLTLDESEEL